MTTIAKDVAAKFAVAFVAAAMIFTAFAPAASAQEQSVEDLQALINSLMSQISALEGGEMSSVNTPALCPYTWTRDLSQGSTGADVMKLQQFLNSNVDTRVAATGAGSVGAETNYYGPATAAAVSKMQVMYRADILTPAGLVNPTGYFGPSTRAKANSVCVAAPTTPTTPTEPVEGGEEEEEEEEGPMSLSGEASLDNFELDDGESSVEEGEENEVVGEIAVEFQDGDAEISRIDVTLENGSAEPWEAFETVSLWVDGDMVAEFDATDEDDYLDEDDGEIRFSGLDIVAEEDEELEILVAVSVQNNLDAAELGDWTLEVSSMRFFDADGVATTENDPAGSDDAEFEVEEAGADEELSISLASSNPDSTDIVVDTDSDTDGVTIMVADLEAEESDIELESIVVRVNTAGASTTDVVDSAYVVIDGQEFEAEAVEVSGAESGLNDNKSQFTTDDAREGIWYWFDIDGDVTIDEDEEVEMEVVIDFNDTDDGARYANGQTIEAVVTATERGFWAAEGDDDLTDANGKIDGAANGDSHTLVAEGILVPSDAVSEETDVVGEGGGQIGEFILEFEVTAIEGDFYINGVAALSSTTPASGVGYTFSGPDLSPESVDANLTSSADEDNAGVFEVNEGETETFTLTVSIDPDVAGQYRVRLDDVFYTDNTDGTTGVIEYSTIPAQDFRTGFQSIVNT